MEGNNGITGGVKLARGRTWTEEEIFYLENLYSKKGAKKIADKLGRSENSVIHKASQLKLKREPGYNAYNAHKKEDLWTQEEFDYLRENYGRMSTVRLSAEMNRPMSTIWEYASKMGLHKNRKIKEKQCTKISCFTCRPWNQWEKDLIKENCYTMHWKQMQRNGLHRSGSAITNQMIRMGLGDYRVKQIQSYGIIFYYRTEEEKQQKWDYVNFWKEVTEDAYRKARRAGKDVRTGIEAI